MTPDFHSLIRACTPKEALFLHTEPTKGRMMELKDGRLLNFVGGQIGAFEGNLLKCLSTDGGATWSETEPLLDSDSQPIPGTMPVEVDEGEGVGSASRWNTLRALRVLDWYSARV